MPRRRVAHCIKAVSSAGRYPRSHIVAVEEVNLSWRLLSSSEQDWFPAHTPPHGHSDESGHLNREVYGCDTEAEITEILANHPEVQHREASTAATFRRRSFGRDFAVAFEALGLQAGVRAP